MDFVLNKDIQRGTLFMNDSV